MWRKVQPNLSGAVETVSSTMLQNRATNNVGIALQGLVPNLQISPNGGSADAVPSFNVRGETSINGGAPLILVDGIPTSAGDFADHKEGEKREIAGAIQ